MVGWACNGDSTTDGGTDATTEPPIDLCSQFTNAGATCPHASNAIVCFYEPSCEASNGCTCSASSSGPVWKCNTPPECIQPCGNSSPLADASCEAGDASPKDAAIEDAGTDATDSGADAPDGD